MTNTPKRSGITVRHTKDGLKVDATGAAAREFLRQLAGLPPETGDAKQAAAFPANDKDSRHEA